MRRREKAALVALFAIAAVLRMAAPELVSFTADEGIHGIGAMEIAVFEAFPMVGLPSVGIRNSALFLYFLAVPFFIWSNPIAGVLAVAAVNLLSMFVAYRIARRAFGVWPAMLALALVTFSPWSVVYARNMWPPSCVVLPCLLLIDATLAWLDDGSQWRLLWMMLLALVCPQMHFSGFCAPVWLLIALWVGRSQFVLLPTFAGALAGLATWSPWIYWQHKINQWQDISQLLRNAKGTTTLVQTVQTALEWWSRTLGSSGFDYWFGNEVGPAAPANAAWFSWLAGVVNVALVIVAASATLWALVHRDRGVRLLGLWSILPLGMLVVLRPVVHPHYVWVAAPIPFILMGGLLGQRVGFGGRGQRHFAALFVMIVVALHSGFMIGWGRFIAADGPTGAGHFQLSLRQRRLVVESIYEDWKTSNADGITGLFSGEQPAYGFLFHHLLMQKRAARRPTDERLSYWVDEERCDELGAAAVATLRNWQRYPNPTVVKFWRVGPSRIFLVRRS